ncbi:MAG: hypothetical protein AAGJ32_11760 [Pseudomonadota bacterium]
MMKSILKYAAVLSVTASVGLGTASAQECLETQFSSKTGQTYLNAETKLMVDEDPAGALAELNKLQGIELNCYERGAVLRLGAAIKVQNGDYTGAARDLERALADGFIPADQAANTYYNLSQLHLQADDKVTALNYMERWIGAGATPTRDQNWQLAVLYQQTDQDRKALPYAERVFEADGPNAERQVYDFLIFLYDRTGQLAKKAQLLEVLLARNPTERKLWDAIAGDYFRADEQRKAFEVQKAMYLAGLLTTEDEIMRVVNFYNQFDVPYQAAKILEKEMNAGRIPRTQEKMELLVNLYQVAREFERAIPIIEQAAQMGGGGQMYERLGRSYAELKNWAKTEEAMLKAINAGGLNDRSGAWVLIGQSRYERDDRSGAREAFREANSRGGRGWLDFMASEDNTAVALRCFDLQSAVLERENEKKACDQVRVLGEAQMPDTCKTIDERITVAKDALAADEACAARAT